MSNAKNNKKEIVLTSQYLFSPEINHTNHLRNVQNKINSINDNDKTTAINNLNQDITNIMKKYNEMNAPGSDQDGKITSFLANYKFTRNNNEVNVRTSLFKDILTNPSIVQGNNVITPEAHSILNKANMVEGDNTGFNFFNLTTVFSSTLKQAAESHNKLVKQNDDLYRKVAEQQDVLKNQTSTIQDLSNNITRLQEEDETNKAEINELTDQKTKAETKLAIIQSDNNFLTTLLAQQKLMIKQTQTTLEDQQKALDANNTITEQAKEAATAAKEEAAVARIAAEQAQTEAAAAQTEAAAAKEAAASYQIKASEAVQAKAKAKEKLKAAEDAKTQAEEKQKAAEDAKKNAEAQAEEAKKNAEAAQAQADEHLQNMQKRIEEFTEANKELTEKQRLSQKEIANLKTRIENAHDHLKNQTIEHQKAIKAQEAKQEKQIEELKKLHEAALEAKKQEFNAQKNAIKFISSLTNFAKQTKIKALEKQFKVKEAAYNKSIAELGNINKSIIREKEANIKELTSEVTKLKIDKDGNVKGPLTTITRLFPLAWNNSKGYNIGNIITLVRGDKPYSTTDNVDHYLYNLFQSIQEETGKTSTDAKKKYDKKYKSSPYQQHVSKNIPINQAYNNNNIARATMIENNTNPNSNDNKFQTGFATVVQSARFGDGRKSKKRIHLKKSKKHKKHNKTKKQK